MKNLPVTVLGKRLTLQLIYARQGISPPASIWLTQYYIFGDQQNVWQGREQQMAGGSWEDADWKRNSEPARKTSEQQWAGAAGET